MRFCHSAITSEVIEALVFAGQDATRLNTESQMTQPKTIADNYLDVWNETDATERRALLNNGWAANALYSDRS